MSDITKIVMWFIVAAVAVDVLTHPTGFATATNSMWNGFDSSLHTVSGQG